jgi:phosphoglycolate phosphatase-like HAD superfamily hydrolase
MDPITLFALANGAVSAVKAGCKLYKDIKGAAGEVKDVLKDLDDQFHKLHPPEKPPTVAQKNAYIEEKNRVVALNKRATADEHQSIYQEIGNHLGTYYDNYYKCIAVFEEEERRAKTEVYTGDDSIGKRALQRVLLRKQLQQMEVELRELMVYQSPPELGALYTEVEEMMKQMGKEQSALIAKQMQRQAIENKRKAARRKQLNIQFAWGMGVLVIIFFFFFVMMLVAQSRQQMYPQYGDEFFPKTEEERRREAQPHVYVGR